MSHEIFGDRFLGIREGAWHRIGTVLDEEIPASDAIKVAKIDYGVNKVPLFLPGNVESGYSAIVRDATEDDPEQYVFGVGKSYELVHITELAEQLDSFPWPITSVGSLRKGAEIFICYDLGEREIFGEGYQMNLAIVHPYEPGSSWRAMLTPTRIVCQNTLVLGEGMATSKFSVSHAPGAKERIDTAFISAKAAIMEDRTQRALEHLKKVKINEKRMGEVLAGVYPYVRTDPSLFDDSLPADDPRVISHKEKFEREQKYVERLKLGATETYNKFCDEHSEFAKTGYGLYQSIVEWSDWRRGRGGEDRIAEQSLVGLRAAEKKRAYNLIVNN